MNEYQVFDFHMSFRTSVKLKPKTITIGTSLMLQMHVMVDWLLSKQAIRWPVLREQIADSVWELIEVGFFKLTADGAGFILDRKLKSGYYPGKEGKRGRAKALIPLCIVTFLLTYSCIIFFWKVLADTLRA